MSGLAIYALNVTVLLGGALAALWVRTRSGRHDWSPWRKWRYESEDSRWILSQPQVRDCLDCNLTQRHRWWRR